MLHDLVIVVALAALAFFSWELALSLTMGITVRRLFFGSLSHIPSHPLARLSGLYELFWDGLCRGRYTWQIMDMHAKRGPIVRISPCEVHISDVNFIDHLYPASSNSRVEKWPWAMRMFGSLERAEAVRTGAYRRQMPHTFFSNTSIHQRLSIIEKPLSIMTERLNDLRGSDQPVNMTWLFAGILQDITLMLCFGESYDNTAQPEWGRRQLEMNMSLLRLCHLQAHFPVLLKLKQILPRRLMGMISPSYVEALRLQEQWLERVTTLHRRYHAGELVMTPETQNATLFNALISNPNSPPSEKTINRLLGEATSVIGAGVLTPTEVHKNLVYYILATPNVLTKLLAEFTSVGSTDVPSLTVLQSLPYFTAVIQEGLRISYGVPHRLQRVHPDRDLIYVDPATGKQYHIPKGTPVGMTSNFVSDNPEVFPEPRVFKPERWLSSVCPRTGATIAPLDFRKTTMVFGRGTRDCIGRWIAYAELYKILGTLFWKFGRDMQLHDADCARDIDVSHDYFVSGVRGDSKGLLVTFDACSNERHEADCSI